MTAGPDGRGGDAGRGGNREEYRFEFRGRRAPAAVRLDIDLGVLPFEIGEVSTGGEVFAAGRVRDAADLLGVPLVNRRVKDAATTPVYFYRADADAGADADAEFAALRPTLEVALTALRPSPAVVVDAKWRIVAANPGLALLTAGITPALRGHPLNLLELALSPGGFFSRVGNPEDWRAGWRERVMGADPDRALCADVRRLLDIDLRNGPNVQNGHLDIGSSTYSAEIRAGGTKSVSCDVPDIRSNAAAVASTIDRRQETKRFGVPLRLRCGKVDLSFLVTDSSDEPSSGASVDDWHVIVFLPADELTVRLMHELIPVALTAGVDEDR